MLRKIALLTLIFAVSTHSKANPFARMARNFAAQKVAQVRKNFTAHAQTLPPTAPANPIDYSINLMWINKDLKKDQKHITLDRDNVHETLLKPAFGWAEKNPESKSVTLWIDSQMTSPQAITNTKNLIDEHNKKHSKKIAPIIIEDIRKLPEVKKNTEVFSDKTPVYFRADLLRVIAAVNAVSAGKTKNFVYADLDVIPITKEELFDDETKKKLAHYGMVMAHRKGHFKFENSFQITSNNNPKLFEAIQYALIDTNIKRAYNALNGKFCITGHKPKGNGTTEPLQQVVYDSHRQMFMYLYHIMGEGTLVVDCLSTPYDKQKHGLKPFGLQKFNHRLALNVLDILQNKSESYEVYDIEIPTKKVKVPPPSMNYN